ncbi:MAG: type IV toxin-antitoxin system AbiEi family antitoxin domain-containing protein [Spirochaetaceae bacterium]|nr:type IV toxin-antitoxin system AbiEi family antitoxin domain-containing protein [Spirochaetaceae bacterium]
MPYAPFLAPELLALAATQRGVFTAAQARAVGHTQNDLQRLRRHKYIVSVRRGVYALRKTYVVVDAAKRHGMQVAALGLVLTPPATLSHESAAGELGLELLEPDLSLLHVTRADDAGTRVEAGVKHHCAEVPESHLVRREGELDLTTLARAAIDIAREAVRLECAVAAIDSALRLGVTRDELAAVMLRCRSWRGARIASRALSLADGRAANPGESWSRVVLIQQGLPPTGLQVPVYDDDGLIGYADFGWDGVLGELDGKGKYGIGVDTDPEEAARIVWREKRREDRLRALGNEVVRWTYAEHHRPQVIAARVIAAQARAAERRQWSG